MTAYRAALRLLDLVVPLEGFCVNVVAEAHTLAEAQRLAFGLPEAFVNPEDPDVPESSDEIRADILTGAEGVERFFPVTLSMVRQPVGSVEQH